MKKNDFQLAVEAHVTRNNSLLSEVKKLKTEKPELKKELQKHESEVNHRLRFLQALVRTMDSSSEVFSQFQLTEKSLDGIICDAKSIEKASQLFEAIASKSSLKITDSAFCQFLSFVLRSEKKELHFNTIRKNLYQVRANKTHLNHEGFRQVQMCSKLLVRLNCGQVVETDKEVSDLSTESSKSAFVLNRNSGIVKRLMEIYSA